MSRSAYLRLYPEDSSVVETRWVVVNGCRRLAAARKYGRTDLDIVVKDDVARDRVTLLTAAISESVDRVGFDVIEEAKAVEQLVAECGSGDAAAARLRKTKGWVSQRRALLKLAPELQVALPAGDLALRVARSLAQVPLEQQVAAWRAAQENAVSGEAGEGPEPRKPKQQNNLPSTGDITRALRQFDTVVTNDRVDGVIGPWVLSGVAHPTSP